MHSKVDTYLQEGCGRCPHYRTPQCKVHTWVTVLKPLRRMVLDCGLTEAFKWSQPCYTHQGKNVLIVTAFKDYACLSFFKGSLLKDPEGILVKPGQSSQAARQWRFTQVDQVIAVEPIIKAYVREAMELEESGQQVAFKKNPEPWPAELRAALAEDAALKAAFQTLTPGRQRGYVLHFSQPKTSKTRVARIQKCTPMILSGIGLHDKYKSRKK